MKSFGGFETFALKQHFGKKLMELEDEKRIVQVNDSFIVKWVLLYIIILIFPRLTFEILMT